MEGSTAAQAVTVPLNKERQFGHRHTPECIEASVAFSHGDQLSTVCSWFVTHRSIKLTRISHLISVLRTIYFMPPHDQNSRITLSTGMHLVAEFMSLGLGRSVTNSFVAKSLAPEIAMKIPGAS